MKIKKTYIPPRLERIDIKHEDNLAAGSAKIIPSDENNQIKTEWEKEETNHHDLIW